MTQEQRLDFLLQYLLVEYCGSYIFAEPEGYAEKRTLLRALANLRLPLPISEEFLQVQDAFLQAEALEKGVVTLTDVPALADNPRLSLWQGDITRLAVDAIVNAANEQMLGCFAPGHHCIDNAIHTAAGVQLRAECSELMQAQGYTEPTGQAKMTRGYNLPARYVLHTVGPIVQGKPSKEQEEQLCQCYRACLALAAEQGLRSMAFCCISTGLFAFPQELAARLALRTVREYLELDQQIERVVFNVFTDEDLRIYQELLRGIRIK